MFCLLQYDPYAPATTATHSASQGINGFGLDGWEAFGAFGAVLVVVALIGMFGIRSLLRALTKNNEAREQQFIRILNEERAENSELVKGNVRLAMEATAAIARSNEIQTQQLGAVNDLRKAIELDNQATRSQIKESEANITRLIKERIPKPG